MDRAGPPSAPIASAAARAASARHRPASAADGTPGAENHRTAGP